MKTMKFEVEVWSDYIKKDVVRVTIRENMFDDIKLTRVSGGAWYRPATAEEELENWFHYAIEEAIKKRVRATGYKWSSKLFSRQSNLTSDFQLFGSNLRETYHLHDDGVGTLFGNIYVQVLKAEEAEEI